MWQKIFVLQNLEKRFRFLCLNYTTKQTQSQHILFYFCLFFFVYKQKTNILLLVLITL